MTSRLAVVASIVMLASFQVAAAAEGPAKSAFRAGAAAGNITPPIGLPIVGGFSPAPSKHVHDELHARCFVFDDGTTKLALVVCDLLGVHYNVSREARRQIEAAVGIPPSHVMISATHTHSASSALGDNSRNLEDPLTDYQKFVATRIADGVRRAANNLTSAELAFGQVDVPEHVHNRRWFLRPGSMPVNPFGETHELVKMNPGAGSPNLVEPAGPVDPQISFIAVREAESQRPIGVLAAYSLHYVGGTAGGAISADYFALFGEALTDLLGVRRQDPPFVAAMANATSGDINNINFTSPRGKREPYEQMRYVADDCAAKVRGALESLEYRRDLTLDARYREPEITLRKPTAEQIEWAKRIQANPETAPVRVTSLAYAERVLYVADSPETAAVPVQALRIGDVCIGTMPCEVFAEIGLDFKSRSPLKPAFMIELAHGYYGYLPTPRHFDLGGYETWIGTNRLEKTASEKLLKNLLEMAAELKP